MSINTAYTSATGTNSTATTSNASSTLNMAGFLQLMVAQLKNQDPLQPMDDSSFYSQMAQLGTVQGINNMQSSMQVSTAASLIGKTVTATVPVTAGVAGGAVTGTVIGLTNSNGTYQISLQSANGNVTNVSLSSIQTVTNTPASTSSTGSTTG